jgi:hypothetical protein
MDIIKYFTFLTGLIPTDSQKKLLKEAINIKEKKILISAGRQSGKTLTTAVIVMWYIFEYGEPVKVVLISAQDDIVYFHMREMFKKHPELVQQLSPRSKLAADLIPIHGFELEKGSIVFIRGATEKQIRGTPADIVVIDEACLVKNDIILTSFGNITGKLAKFIGLSTPDVDTSLFVKWATDNKAGFKVHQWSATLKECPWHDKTIEETKKKEYSKERYATEVLGRPKTAAERSFFTRKHLEKCIYDIEPIREGKEQSRIEIGIDFGMTESWTVLTVTERIGTTKRKVLYIKYWKLPPEQVAPEIMKEIEKWKPYLVKADSKPPEYMQALKRYTNTIEFIDATFHKEQILGQMLAIVRSHNLIIPINFVTLIKQMQNYRKGMTKGDDYVDSLGYSIYEPPEGFKKRSYGCVYFPE